MIAKRALDVAGASVGLLVSAPFLAAAAAAGKRDDRGPRLYRPRRGGQEDSEF